MITYDSSSKVIFENEIPDLKLLSSIIYTKGSQSNFNKPLLDAFKIC